MAISQPVCRLTLILLQLKMERTALFTNNKSYQFHSASLEHIHPSYSVYTVLRLERVYQHLSPLASFV